jgi:hypothetical protein
MLIRNEQYQAVKFLSYIWEQSVLNTRRNMGILTAATMGWYFKIGHDSIPLLCRCEDKCKSCNVHMVFEVRQIVTVLFWVVGPNASISSPRHYTSRRSIAPCMPPQSSRHAVHTNLRSDKYMMNVATPEYAKERTQTIPYPTEHQHAFSTRITCHCLQPLCLFLCVLCFRHSLFLFISKYNMHIHAHTHIRIRIHIHIAGL